MTFDQLTGEIKKKIYHPVYFLQGDEPYYIDQVSDLIEKSVLSESEKEFNQSVLYGKELDMPTLISYARRYPMMSNYQVVVVREAQDMKALSAKEKDGDSKSKSKDPKDLLVEYLANPTKSTVLVLCYKYKTLDKRTKLARAMEKSAVVFKSDRIYDDKLPAWVTSMVMGKGFRINPKASVMMAEYLGNDLSKISNETDKLTLNLKPGDEITPAMVEENIGVSKDFNIFELLKALGRRNILKANQIVNYFAANPKNNPMVLSLTQLHSFFMKLLAYHQLQDHSRQNVASALGVNPYFVADYETGAKAYSAHHCVRNIGFLRDYDLRSKGVNNVSTEDGALMKELIFRILH